MTAMKSIKIDRYETRLVKGEARTFAIKGEKEYYIPNAFVGMCDEDHLAIAQAQTVMAELFDTEDVYYVPLRTRD